MADDNLPDDNKFNLNDYLTGPQPTTGTSQTTALDNTLQKVWDAGSGAFSFLSKEAGKVGNGFLNLWSGSTWFSAAIAGGILAGLIMLIVHLVTNHGISHSLNVKSAPGKTQPPIVVTQLQNLQSQVQRAGTLLETAGAPTAAVQTFQRNTLLERGTQIVSDDRKNTPSELIPNNAGKGAFQVTSSFSPSSYVSVQQVNAGRYIHSLAGQNIVQASIANSAVIHGAAVHQASQ